MPRTFDITGFFDQEAYSDITLKFGSRERKCHKMILCSKSPYLARLCGPEGKFKEASQSLVKLEENDEEAVEAVLRWLYTFDYEVRAGDPKLDSIISTPDFHLSVCVVANKFMLDDLEVESMSRMRVKLDALDDTNLSKFMEKVYWLKNGDVPYPQKVTDIVDEVRDSRLRPLIKNEAFRQLLIVDEDLCLTVIDKLSDGAPGTTPATSVPQNKVEKTFTQCGSCGRRQLWVAVSANIGTCDKRSCNHRFSASEKRRVWVEA